MALTVAIILAFFAPWPWNLIAVLGGIGIEAVETRAQLPVLVPQLPVRFGEPLQASGQAPRFQERGEGDENGSTGKKSQ